MILLIGKNVKKLKNRLSTFPYLNHHLKKGGTNPMVGKILQIWIMVWLLGYWIDRQVK